MPDVPAAAPAAALDIATAAALPAERVVERVGGTATGLSTAEAKRRLLQVGPNAVRTHRTRAWMILAAQFRNAVLILLLVTAVISLFLGDRTDAAVIMLILLVSVGLGFVNEYRAGRAADALHAAIDYTAVVLRDGAPIQVDVIAWLSPGPTAAGLATERIRFRDLESHGLGGHRRSGTDTDTASLALGGACCVELQDSEPGSRPDGREPGFTLRGSHLADLAHDRLYAFPPLAALRPAPGDRIGYGEEQLMLRAAVFVAQGAAAPDCAGDLDEAPLIPPQEHKGRGLARDERR